MKEKLKKESKDQVIKVPVTTDNIEKLLDKKFADPKVRKAMRQIMSDLAKT